MRKKTDEWIEHQEKQFGTDLLEKICDKAKKIDQEVKRASKAIRRSGKGE